MTDDDLELEQQEKDLALTLASSRPVPAPEFRGALGRHLAAHDPGYGPRPARLGILVSMYALAGAALIGLGALQSAGAL